MSDENNFSIEDLENKILLGKEIAALEKKLNKKGNHE